MFKGLGQWTDEEVAGESVTEMDDDASSLSSDCVDAVC